MLSWLGIKRGAVPRLGRPHAGLVGAAAALLAAAASSSCDRATGPIDVSYIAIVALLDTPAGVSPGARYAYRVREVSGTLNIDTTIAVDPRDTVILRMPVATYAVELTGLPEWCASRYGPEQFVVVFDPPSTALARYFVTCRAPLTVQLVTDGPEAPPAEMVYRLSGATETRVGIAHPSDTLRFDHLAPGEYEFALSVLSPDCVVTSDGAERPRVTVPEGGGAVLAVKVACSEPARRPQLLHAAASYHDGVSGFVFRVADPDRDVERYVWDVTDCRGTSILPGGARLRRGLSSGRTRDRDTVTVIGVFEPALADAAVVGRCTALRVIDQRGNTTPLVELPIRDVPGAAPTVSLFNAYSIGTVAIRVDLATADADGDAVGVFATAVVRDGVFFAPDGAPDVGIYNVSGYLGDRVEDLPLGTRIMYGDVYSIVLYLVDAAGHFTRVTDGDVFR